QPQQSQTVAESCETVQLGESFREKGRQLQILGRAGEIFPGQIQHPTPGRLPGSARQFRIIRLFSGYFDLIANAVRNGTRWIATRNRLEQRLEIEKRRRRHERLSSMHPAGCWQSVLQMACMVDRVAIPYRPLARRG